jgi:membrane protease YdiL (CAAX protease family)
MVGAWWQYRSQPWPAVSKEMGLAKDHAVSGLRWGAGAFAVVAAVLLAGVLLADLVPPIATLLEDERAEMFADDLWYVTLIRIPLGTAVFEEVAFRGVLLAAAMRSPRGGSRSGPRASSSASGTSLRRSSRSGSTTSPLRRWSGSARSPERCS